MGVWKGWGNAQGQDWAFWEGGGGGVVWVGRYSLAVEGTCREKAGYFWGCSGNSGYSGGQSWGHSGQTVDFIGEVFVVVFVGVFGGFGAIVGVFGEQTGLPETIPETIPEKSASKKGALRGISEKSASKTGAPKLEAGCGGWSGGWVWGWVGGLDQGAGSGGRVLGLCVGVGSGGWVWAHLFYVSISVKVKFRMSNNSLLYGSVCIGCFHVLFYSLL